MIEGVTMIIDMIVREFGILLWIIPGPLSWFGVIKTYVLKKTSKFNYKDKTMLVVNIGSLVLAIILIGIGIVFANSLIQTQNLPEIPEDAHETHRYYEFLVISFIVGIVLIVSGFIWAGLNLKSAIVLFSLVVSRKKSKKRRKKKKVTKPEPVVEKPQESEESYLPTFSNTTPSFILDHITKRTIDTLSSHCFLPQDSTPIPNILDWDIISGKEKPSGIINFDEIFGKTQDNISLEQSKVIAKAISDLMSPEFRKGHGDTE